MSSEKNISKIFENNKKIKELSIMEKEQLIYGIDDYKKTMIISLLHKKQGEPSLVILSNEKKAKEFYENLSVYSDREINFFPNEEIIPFEIAAKSGEIQTQRAEVLGNLAFRKDSIVVTSFEALRKKIVPKAYFDKEIRKYKLLDKVDLKELTRYLVRTGYERKELTLKPGEFSLRGGILDVFLVMYQNPVRIEFFDDEIDSIRFFNLESQKSIEKIQEIVFSPAREFFVDCGTDFLDKLEKDYIEQLDSYGKDKKAANGFKAFFEETRGKLISRQDFSDLEYFYDYFFEEASNLLDYFPEESLVFVDDPNRINSGMALLTREDETTYKSLLEKGRLFREKYGLVIDSDCFVNKIRSKRNIYLNLLPCKNLDQEEIVKKVNLDTIRELVPLNSSQELFRNLIREKLELNYTIILSLDNEDKENFIKEDLEKNSINFEYLKDLEDLSKRRIYLGNLNLDRGFEDKEQKIIIISEYDIFTKKKKKRKAIFSKDSERIGSLYDLNVGDFIVHSNHGIGKYMGIEKVDVQGVSSDYLVVQYKGTDKLFVPTDQVNNLQKYVGSEDKVPKVNKLGGSEWQKTKAKAQKSIEDMTEALLELYSKREVQRGHAFSKDDYLQAEFEEVFPFEETRDQLKAIEDIKSDMEKDISMDRLLCGDVGYGKTEVAMRAAFKSARDNKQVAVLVPTTILAEQHFLSFKKRFEGFPVEIEVLSRFKSAKEEQEIKEKLKRNQIDIIIGTHKLLGKTIKFNNLGLLIIDEEQRFGVKDKEKIKALKTNVDVLTLSATPIPRTLHMSLVGLRDMSLIETPPKNRFPIQTFVLEKSEDLLKEVILRELGRGGQVYFVHNRVNDIQFIAGRLQELLPETRIGIAHGRMNETLLEDTMLNFMRGELDVLVCTTIIETGLDIPNVNTLIVDEADKYGLSQLYQLRGRVGRSDRIAFAYLTYKKDRILSENAEKRLKAIKDFTELGSGFKIALRDLEIRGSGNILGREQHGYLESVGFALYTQMLQEAVENVKLGRETSSEKVDIEIKLPVSALIPDGYMENPGIKLEFYQRIKIAESLETINDLDDELVDRFGDYPKEVKNLLEIGRIRVVLKNLGVKLLRLVRDRVEIHFSENIKVGPEKIVGLSKKYLNKITFKEMDGFLIKLNMKFKSEEELVEKIKNLLKELN